VSFLLYEDENVINIPLRMFSGQTPLGHDFGHLYGAKRWQDAVLGPLAKFAEKVYRK
jgi:hypothetical protein